MEILEQGTQALTRIFSGHKSGCPERGKKEGIVTVGVDGDAHALTFDTFWFLDLLEILMSSVFQVEGKELWRQDLRSK